MSPAPAPEWTQVEEGRSKRLTVLLMMVTGLVQLHIKAATAVAVHSG